MKRSYILLCFILFILWSGQSVAVGIFIPAANRIDVAHDFSRNFIYISNGPEILRFDVAAQAMLPPVNIGGTLSGMDISPDGNTLAVANRVRVGEEVFIHLIDLDSLVVESISFPRAFYEGGSWTVVYTSDDKIMITSLFEGSGWVPMRLYDPISKITETLDSVRLGTMIRSSGDRNTIAFAEASASNGPFGRYEVLTQSIVDGPGTGWFNYEIGVNHNGSQYSVPTYGGTFVYDLDWNLLGTLGIYANEQPMGVVYHPAENIVYYPWARTQEIRVYNSATLSQIDAYNFEDTFQHPGNGAFRQGRLKMADDGSMLLATVTGGVRYLQLYSPLTTSPQDLIMDENSSLPITLSATVGNGGEPTFTILDSPLNGVLNGAPPNLVYIPNTGFSGQDSFYYEANYGKARMGSVVTIGVIDTNSDPIANDDSATLNRKRITISVLDNDSDPDGDQLQVISVSSPSYGTASIANEGTEIKYRRGRRYRNIIDQFTYTISDGNGGTATATIEVRYP